MPLNNSMSLPLSPLFLFFSLSLSLFLEFLSSDMITARRAFRERGMDFHFDHHCQAISSQSARVVTAMRSLLSACGTVVDVLAPTTSSDDARSPGRRTRISSKHLRSLGSILWAAT
ncbi:hypothetical protein F5Y19DRAFT_425048 [Xylariaceae sp. FL1651]|nr:hypothetical protein F5Y19DRAFT_425048 [Xylariaceae sp. FL1651]